MRTTQPGLALALSLVLAATAGAQDDGFTPLVQGDDPQQFHLVGIGPEAITVENGEVRLAGTPNGYFGPKGEFTNYVLRFDWMYERPEGLDSDEAFRGNSGLLVHIVGEDKVWPQCVEVQLANNDAGRIFAINGSEFAGEVEPEARRRAQREAIKPVGQWNREEVVCKDGAITCTINGVEVDRGAGASPASGRIGLQSEGAPIRFRNLQIQVLD